MANLLRHLISEAGSALVLTVFTLEAHLVWERCKNKSDCPHVGLSHLHCGCFTPPACLRLTLAYINGRKEYSFGLACKIAFPPLDAARACVTCTQVVAERDGTFVQLIVARPCLVPDKKAKKTWL